MNTVVCGMLSCLSVCLIFWPYYSAPCCQASEGLALVTDTDIVNMSQRSHKPSLTRSSTDQMSTTQQFNRFTLNGEARILPAQIMVCLGMLDTYDSVIQDCEWLCNGFGDASFLKYEGVTECDSVDQLTSVFCGSGPSVLFFVFYSFFHR